MKKELLRDLMKKIELNYGPDKFKITKPMFELWYDMFSDCNEYGLKQAVDKCIKENEFAPNVAGLMKYYKALEEAHNELEKAVKHNYSVIRAIWEEEYDDNTLMELWTYINRFPEKTRQTELVELTQRAVSFRHDCEGCGRKDYPTILEYLKGAR